MSNDELTVSSDKVEDRRQLLNLTSVIHGCTTCTGDTRVPVQHLQYENDL